jgi:hypothetical protein
LTPISRFLGRCQLILVASRSIFELFRADEETFTHSQLWKNLVKGMCSDRMWAGQCAGRQVKVGGGADGG